MHHQASKKLFERQIRSAMRADSSIDFDKLKALVTKSYDKLPHHTLRATGRNVQKVPHRPIKQETAPVDEKVAHSIAFYKRQIARQNTHMSAIINKLEFGAGVFDAGGNLVTANHDFADLYGLTEDFLKPGLNIDQINLAIKRNGFVPIDSAPNIYDNWRSYVPGSSAIKAPVAMSNGKIICVGIDPLAEGGWLCTHEDITSCDVEPLGAMAQLDEISHKNIVFDRAINAMFHSMAVFDDDDRLILCNGAFAHMYALPDALTRPGVTLKQIMDHRRTAGSLPVREFDGLQTMLRHVRSKPDETRVLNLEDGRTVRTVRRLLHGVGYIDLSEDITDQTKEIQKLRRHNVRVKAERELLDVTINSILHGMIVLDKDYKIVCVNDAYIKMFHLPASLVRKGADYWELLRYSSQHGVAIGSDFEQSRAIMQKLSSGNIEREQFETKDDRHILLTAHTLEGDGWVFVFDDVTEQVCNSKKVELKTQELADKSNHFLSAMNAMVHAMYVFDNDHKLVMCNRAYQDLFELPDRLIQPGTSIFDILDYRAATTKAVVSMDAEERRRKFEKGFEQSSLEKIRTIRMVNGMVVRMGRQLMCDGNWIGVEEDITEMQRRSELLALRTKELESQNARFDAALNNMSLGLVVFDKDLNLVVCNQRYIDMYQLPENLCVAGASYLDILKHRVGSGLASSHDFEALREEEFSMLRGGQQISGAVKLINGQIIDVSHQMLADGGWFSTHEDVTERETRVKLLAQRSKEWRLQNERFDAALNNMSQGLAVFDTHKKLVVCNDQFASIYRLPNELREPGACYADIMSYRARIGLTPHSDVKKLLRQQAYENETGKATKESVVMMNGSVMMVQSQPMAEGGWLTTHEDITEQHKSESMIRHLARHDGLTGLANRTTFMEAAAEAETKIAKGDHAAILYIDLNKFKIINDELGHAAGDGVLKEVARRLEATAGDLGVCARLGGDEFAILIGPMPHMIDLEKIANNILTAIDQPIALKTNATSLSASLGIAVAPADGQEAEDLLRKADLALYTVKKDLGRGRGYEFFETSMDETHQRRRAVELGLKEAIRRGEMQMYYQPLISLGDNRVTACEALIRWNSKELGFVSPVEFIPIAEETGRIRDLGAWALEKACMTATDWPDHVKVTVNVSAVQFKGGDLFAEVTHALKRSVLDAARLELEVTESLLLDDDKSNLDILHDLKALGVRIALDDFGTGYSSLSYLQRFPFDKVKIDRSFVSDAEKESKKSAIVGAIAQLADSLSMSTTAEGVETENQLCMVKDHGCNEVQGYLFSPPLPESAIGEFVRRPLVLHKKQGLNESAKAQKSG